MASNRPGRRFHRSLGCERGPEHHMNGCDSSTLHPYVPQRARSRCPCSDDHLPSPHSGGPPHRD
jgi:hypothetical protein